jgi:hypothetical protein
LAQDIAGVATRNADGVLFPAGRYAVRWPERSGWENAAFVLRFRPHMPASWGGAAFLIEQGQAVTSAYGKMDMLYVGVNHIITEQHYDSSQRLAELKTKDSLDKPLN